MGAKYLPTKKDLKATQRYQQKQLLPKSAFQKPSALPPAPKAKPLPPPSVHARRAAAIFQVADLNAAVAHYKTVLGFTEDFRFGDYAGLTLGDITLHLSAEAARKQHAGAGSVFVFCEAVDAYFTAIKKRGAIIRMEPVNTGYGRRDFTVADPDGNQLSFSCEIKAG